MKIARILANVANSGKCGENPHAHVKTLHGSYALKDNGGTNTQICLHKQMAAQKKPFFLARMVFSDIKLRMDIDRRWS